MAAHVLIVDDEPELRQMMETLLSTYGFDTSTAGNGMEALDQMRRQRPCVVVLDLMMPLMDGFEFCAERQKDAALVRN